MYKLVIQDDEGKTTVVPLIRDEITIGRKEGNTIRLTERNVSRRHARILRNDGTIHIEDLGSYNGVRVNGAKIAQRTALSVSDRAQIGDYLIEIKAEVVEAAPRAAEASHSAPTVPVRGGVDHALEHQLTTPMAVPPTPEGVVARAADDAPTIKAAAPVAAKAEAAGRLVALSSNFAGQAWTLAADQTVIGRTDDNEVVINHRSISRNHARIVRDPASGRFTISDLQSSNGVRVNGEEYGKFELRRGDLVDLGHVRLRFVEPGEDFVFGRDAQVSDVPTGSSSRPLLIGALAVVLVGGALAAYMVLTRGAEPATRPVAGVGSGSGSAGVGSAGSAVAMVTVDAAPARPDAPPLPTGNAELAAQLTACRALIDKEDWGSLKMCAKDAQALDEGNAEAAGLATQATRELANSMQFDRLNDAGRARNYAAVAEAYGKVDLDSVYRERARVAHDKVRDAYQSSQVAQGKAYANKGRCEDLKKHVAKSGSVWPEVGAAVGAITCTTQIVTDTPPDGPDPQPEACNYEALLAQAKDAIGDQSYGPALKYAEQAAKCNGSPKLPKQLAVHAACKLGNAAKANMYYKQLGSTLPPGIKAACIDIIKP